MNQIINRYYYFRDDFEKVTQQFDPLESGCLAEFNYSYIENVLREFESSNPNLGLEVYVTVWAVNRLPVYGKKVIFLLCKMNGLENLNIETKSVQFFMHAV